MSNYPEDIHHDKLEAYPLRLNVAALPERRFFKMTRTLTVIVVLLTALLIALAVFLNYQITHLDVTVRRNSAWQFYAIDPEEKKLGALESSGVLVDPLRLAVEERILEYLKIRNSTVWNDNIMTNNHGPLGPIYQLSDPQVWAAFKYESESLIQKTKADGLVRDVHIFTLKWMGSNLWMAVIETYDLPIIEGNISECPCSDNSKMCLQCKIDHAKKRERRKIWMRTSFKRRKIMEKLCGRWYEKQEMGGALCATPASCANTALCANPLGISVDNYVSTIMPIHPDAAYWDLPPELHPGI